MARQAGPGEAGGEEGGSVINCVCVVKVLYREEVMCCGTVRNVVGMLRWFLFGMLSECSSNVVPYFSNPLEFGAIVDSELRTKQRFRPSPLQTVMLS